MNDLIGKVKKKTKLPRIFDFNDTESGVEALKSIGSGITGSAKDDLAKASVKDFFNQLSGVSNEAKKHERKLSGELSHGQELDLSRLHKPEKKHKEAGIDYGREYYRSIVRNSEVTMRSETHQVKEQVEEILIEIRQIMQQSEQLKATFVDIAVDQTPSEVGKYHVGFFELMLGFIIQARQKIESAGTWLGAVQGKNNKRDYWTMFGKHGTSFGMSNERNVSTQTG